MCGVDPDQLSSQKPADLEIPVLNMVPKFNIVMVNYCTEPQYVFYKKKMTKNIKKKTRLRVDLDQMAPGMNTHKNH